MNRRGVIRCSVAAVLFGISAPAASRLAEHMGAHVSTVSRSITELEDCSLIEIERRGQGKTNFYTINFVVKKKSRKS